jgi:hypothetical protein
MGDVEHDIILSLTLSLYVWSANFLTGFGVINGGARLAGRPSRPWDITSDTYVLQSIDGPSIDGLARDGQSVGYL